MVFHVPQQGVFSSTLDSARFAFLQNTKNSVNRRGSCCKTMCSNQIRTKQTSTSECAVLLCRHRLCLALNDWRHSVHSCNGNRISLALHNWQALTRIFYLCNVQMLTGSSYSVGVCGECASTAHLCNRTSLRNRRIPTPISRKLSPFDLLTNYKIISITYQRNVRFGFVFPYMP